MNISIANLGTVLEERFQALAAQDAEFLLDWHQGGKYNTYACTSIICKRCGAKLIISHPKLPSRQGKLADPEQLEEVNRQIVQFLFTDHAIRDGDLLQVRVCTLERHHTGSVIQPCAAKPSDSTVTDLVPQSHATASSSEGVPAIPPADAMADRTNQESTRIKEALQRIYKNVKFDASTNQCWCWMQSVVCHISNCKKKLGVQHPPPPPKTLTTK